MAATPDQLIAAEVRAEMARQRTSQTQLARDVFHTYPMFVHARVTGQVPFTAWQLLQVADYLHVDVCQFLAAAKRPTPDDGAPPPTKFHDEGASYDNPVVDVVFNAPVACLAA